MDQNSPEELAFVFLDMTRHDFVYWRQTHLYCPVIVRQDEAFMMLEKLGRLSAQRANGEADASKTLFVHIEECDMVANDTARFESALEAITKHMKNNNTYLVFSTSRPAPGMFTEKILHMSDMRVLHELASLQDYMLVAGLDLRVKLAFAVGRRAVIKNGKAHVLAPFFEEYVEKIEREED